tara:strand:- start:148 stop:378 length:231 start_codon:yes stop_codon:yes gene_type:complete
MLAFLGLIQIHGNYQILIKENLCNPREAGTMRPQKFSKNDSGDIPSKKCSLSSGVLLIMIQAPIASFAKRELFIGD